MSAPARSSTSALEVCSPAGAEPTLHADACEDVAAVLRAVGEPARLAILAAVASAPSGEVCACDLTRVAQVSQPTVSHHLKVLRSAGLLVGERRGTWVHYSVAPGAVPAVTTLLDHLVPALRAGLVPGEKP